MILNIRTKLTLIVLVLGITIGLISSAVVLQYVNKVFNTEFNERLNAVTSSLAMNCMYGVSSSKRSELEKLAANTLHQKDIVLVQIDDKDGNVLCELGKAVRDDSIREFTANILGGSPVEKTGEELLFSFEETPKTELIGVVKVTASLSYFKNRIDSIILVIIIAIISILLLSAVGIIILGNKYIGVPINNLITATQKIASGDMSYRVNITSRDEIGVLANFFNMMAESMEGSIERIKHLAAEAAIAEMEKKRAEELQKTNDTIQKISKELERSNKELEEFAYIASHDLQEPLRMIISFLQLLQRHYHEKLDDNANKFIGYAVDGADRMRGLIQDLLMYARVGSQGKPFKDTDCAKLLESATSNLEVAISESGAKISHDALPTLSCDGTQLIELFQNLMTNAIKFRNKGVTPEIHIRAEMKENEWVFSVADNGIGIEDQYKDRIFMIFQRLHSREEYPGTGIGLAYCKKIVERHGGRIWLESKYGSGTTFYFAIPVNKSEV